MTADGEDPEQDRTPHEADEPGAERRSDGDDIDGDAVFGEADGALTDRDAWHQRSEIRELRAAAFGGGEAVGRDKIINRYQFFGPATGRAWRTRAYTADEMHERLSRFAGTPARQRLADLLRDDHVAVLEGPARTGRKTTALAALSLRCDGVSLIQSDRVPADLTLDDIEPRHGYVLDASDLRWAKRLDETGLLGCQDVLRKRNSRLVVIVSHRSAITSGAVRNRRIEYGPPDMFDVLGRHLKAELPGQTVQSILDQIEQPPDTLHEAIDLARELIDGHVQRCSVRDTLASRPDPLRNRARVLLRQEHDTEDEKDPGRRAFLIASVVLEGMSTGQICRAAQGLAQNLFAIESPNAHARLSQLPFGDVTDTWRHPAGKGFTEAVLDVVWLDYLVSHEALLGWLKWLAADGDPRIRVKAALALGRLAVHDFEFIAQDCLLPWSRQLKGALHDVTAWALETVVVQNPEEYYERVFALADEWAGDSPARRSVAARLYGTHIGAADAVRAMNGLCQISGHGPASVNRLIVWSVVDLFTAGEERAVISALTDWAGSPEPAVRRAAAECLAALTKVDDAGRPVLMLLFDEIPDKITEVWRRVLLSRMSRRQAWNALRAWARDGVDLTALRVRLEAEERLRRPLGFYLGAHAGRRVTTLVEEMTP